MLKDCASQKVSTFIPPYNAFNYATLEAMKDNGLFILSADMFTNIYRDGIQYYPETLGHLMAKKGIWQAAEDAIFGCKEKNAIGVVMFHAYDLPNEASWQRLENLLDGCKADKHVELHTFQSLYESGNSSTQYRYKANQMKSLLQKYLLHSGMLHTTWLCWLVHMLNALMYALVAWVMLALVLMVTKIRFAAKIFRKSWVIIVVAAISLLFFILPLLQIGSPLKLLAVDMSVSGVGCGIAVVFRGWRRV